MYLWHRLMHVLKPRLWVNNEPVDGYPYLYRQQCRECGATRFREVQWK